MKKILMLTTVALLGSTGLVAAQTTTATADAFGQPAVQEDNMLITLPLVTATADGTVEVRGIAGEQQGQVFGSQPVTAGANENVRISLTQSPNADSVLVVLVVDGADVASQEVRLSPPGDQSNRGGNEEDGADEGSNTGSDSSGGDNSGSGGDAGGGNGGGDAGGGNGG